jgi:tetratricopeptide (TPR) repeat protein
MNRISRKLLPVITAILILTLGLFLILKASSHETPAPQLATPMPLLKELLQSESPLFVSPEFLPFIPSLADSQEASHDKSAFWKLYREHHYGAVLLGINPRWHPVLESLLSSPLWTLSDVSPWGYTFRLHRQGITTWSPPSPQNIEKLFPNSSDRARFLILTAANLLAINRQEDAAQLLNMAETTHRLPSLLLSTRASLAAAQGNWEAAGAFAQESLHADSANRAAKEILIRALLESGHADQALYKARDLISECGEDEETLFLMARTASAANSNQEESDALARLVKVARLHHQPVGVSLSYLGQAYAKQGDRGNALRSFQEAILAPELNDEERRAIREIMDHLMQGNTPSSSLPELKSSSGTNP